MPTGAFLSADAAALIQTIYEPELPVALDRTSFIWGRLNEKGKVKRKNQVNINWRVNSEGHGNITTINDGETLPASGKQAYVNPTLNFKILIAMITIGRQTQMSSFGSDSSVPDMLRNEIDRAIEDMARQIHLQIIQTAASTKDISGLEDAIADTGTYAGIARSGNPFWQSYVNDNGGSNRSLTEALMEDVIDTLQTERQSVISEAWCGVTAWNAVRRLIGQTIAPARNNDPESLKAGAMKVVYQGIDYIKVPGYDTNRIDFVDLDSEGGIEYQVQSGQDFVVSPESTDSYDEKASISHHGQLKVFNPFKQGSLQDVQ